MNAYRVIVCVTCGPACRPRHQHGHDAEGCGQEGEHELVHEPGQVAAVALIGEQPDVEPETPVLERAGDPVQAPW